jgi:hypothetical protein
VGWVSFRGYTTSGTKTVYGVDATGNAVGPQVISCGVDKSITSTGSTVTWTVVHDATKITPATYEWVSLADTFSNPVNATTEVHVYGTTGIKTALVKVTTATGELYVVSCDGSVVPGQPDPGFPSVSVGSFDLRADQPANPVGAQQGVPITLNGTFDNLGDVISSSNPFTVRFELDSNLDGVADQYSSDLNISGAASSNNIPVSSSWTPGLQGASYRIRLCVDTTNAIDEGTQEGNNCSSWPGTTFTVGAPPVVAPSGTCTVVPRVSTVGGIVTWDSTASGGDGNYTYSWAFTPPPATYIGGTNNTSADPKVTYGAIGTKTATVTITSQSLSTLPIVCSGSLRVQTITEI